MTELLTILFSFLLQKILHISIYKNLRLLFSIVTNFYNNIIHKIFNVRILKWVVLQDIFLRLIYSFIYPLMDINASLIYFCHLIISQQTAFVFEVEWIWNVRIFQNRDIYIEILSKWAGPNGDIIIRHEALLDLQLLRLLGVDRWHQILP